MSQAPSPKATEFDPVRLIETHQAGVWRYLRALGCDPATADDLTQDAFVAVLQRPFEDYNQAATAAYLRRVAHNLFISMQRRAGKVVATDEVETLDRSWAEWAGEDNGDDYLDSLKECMGNLTERARFALDLRFRKKTSRPEIAKALEITEHGAKNLMQRAKKQLRDCVQNKLDQLER